MQALNDYIIVREAKEKDETTSSGIILSGVDTNLVKATVVSVGSEAKYVDGGQKLIFLRRNCEAIAIKGEKYLVTKSEHIVAKM